MIFRPRKKSLPITRQIIIENNVLEQVDNIKFLGVYIDQHLTWKTHVNFIAAKISKSVGLLYKAKYYLPSKSPLILYYALVYPYLTYCNLIWASTYVTNLQRIYLLQKRIVRTISKADYQASSKPLFLMFLVSTRSEISISQKLGFSEISPPQSPLPSCMLVINLINVFIIFFILIVIYSVWQNDKIKIK